MPSIVIGSPFNFNINIHNLIIHKWSISLPTLSSLSPARTISVSVDLSPAPADIKKVLGEVEATTSDDDINRVI